MTVFLTIMIILLTLSNAFLWVVLKGMQIMIKQICEKIVDLGNAFLAEAERG